MRFTLDSVYFHELITQEEEYADNTKFTVILTTSTRVFNHEGMQILFLRHPTHLDEEKHIGTDRDRLTERKNKLLRHNLYSE